jgi:hypothetical protein
MKCKFEISDKEQDQYQSCLKMEKCRIEFLDSESRLLEELFVKRFNYYSLFAAAFLFLIFQVDSTDNIILFRIGLCVGCVIFGLMFLSIWRTNILINRILAELSKCESYPLSIIFNKNKPIKFPPLRSNTYIVLISLVLFLFILLLTILSFAYAEIFIQLS